MTLNKILSKTAYSAYDKKKYRHDYFDKKTGGYLVIERERIAQSLMNKQEKAKFKREYAMCLTLAKNGYAVEYLKDKPKSYDILLNGTPADLKKTTSHNHIIHYAKKAVYRQNADIVIFEFEKMTMKIQEKLNLIKMMKINILYFISIENKISVL